MSGPAAAPVVFGRAVRPARWLLLIVTVAILAIVLWPSRPAGGAQNSLELWFIRAHAAGLPRWITFGLVEFCANVVMFVPIGALASLARFRGGPAAVVLGAAALSGTVELLQWSALPNRTGDLRDVLANTLGAAIGVLLVAGCRRRATTHGSRPAASGPP